MFSIERRNTTVAGGTWSRLLGTTALLTLVACSTSSGGGGDGDSDGGGSSGIGFIGSSGPGDAEPPCDGTYDDDGAYDDDGGYGGDSGDDDDDDGAGTGDGDGNGGYGTGSDVSAPASGVGGHGTGAGGSGSGSGSGAGNGAGGGSGSGSYGPYYGVCRAWMDHMCSLCGSYCNGQPQSMLEACSIEEGYWACAEQIDCQSSATSCDEALDCGVC